MQIKRHAAVGGLSGRPRGIEKFKSCAAQQICLGLAEKPRPDSRNITVVLGLPCPAVLGQSPQYKYLVTWFYREFLNKLRIIPVPVAVHCLPQTAYLVRCAHFQL